MASDASPVGPTHRSKNSALFLRHIPHPSHDLEGGAGLHHGGGSSSSSSQQQQHTGRPGSPPSRRLHALHNLPLDEEDKAKPLQGRGALLGRTQILLRRALDSVGWPLTSTPPLQTAAATATAAGGRLQQQPHQQQQQQHTPVPPSANGGAGAYASLLAFARWRTGSLDGSHGAASTSSGPGGLLRPRPGAAGAAAAATAAASYRHYPFRRPHHGLKVGPLLAAPPGRSGEDAAGTGAGAGSALERISISLDKMNSAGAARECPVELIAPCAVPSASLKELGVLREEGRWVWVWGVIWGRGGWYGHPSDTTNRE